MQKEKNEKNKNTNDNKTGQWVQLTVDMMVMVNSTVDSKEKSLEKSLVPS